MIVNRNSNYDYINHAIFAVRNIIDSKDSRVNLCSNRYLRRAFDKANRHALSLAYMKLMQRHISVAVPLLNVVVNLSDSATYIKWLIFCNIQY